MTNRHHTNLRGYALVLAAACCWATIGLFYRTLVDDYGLSRQAVVAFRAGLAALMLLAGLALRRPASLRIRRRDLPFFLLFGGIGVAGFFLSYIGAIAAGSVAQAAVLLYTAPLWIALWSAVRTGETLEGRRLFALMLAVLGCALVAQAYDPSKLRLNAAAVLLGLLAGIGYAAYTLFSAEGTRRGYTPWTVVLYSLGIGAALLFATTPADETLKALRAPASWPMLLGVALVPSFVAQMCFTFGLQYIRTSTASILATIEPVVAAALAWAFLGEALALPQVAGGACVVLAVIMLIASNVRPLYDERPPAALGRQS